jgi:excisionase family DNA binding protein
MDRPLTMTVEEAAELIGISRTSAYLCAARGEIPTRRFGRRLVVLALPFLESLGECSTPSSVDEPST